MPDVAHYMINRLHEWGIDHVYGYLGDGINAFLGAGEKVDKPVLEFNVDPQIPPLPPHVNFDQLKKTANAMVQGDEDVLGLATKGIKGKLAEVKEHLPGADP
jgi:hypothetical protein